uniref:Uncharacterized protein n=1 Tax=Caenorhabditis japonica TaxID=281687 RepID=A0A8R1IJS6_CAEJA
MQSFTPAPFAAAPRPQMSDACTQTFSTGDIEVLNVFYDNDAPMFRSAGQVSLRDLTCRAEYRSVVIEFCL